MIQIELDGMRWEVQRGWADVLERILHSQGEPVKTSPAKRVTRHRVDGRMYYLKRYLHDAVFWRSFKFWFKPTQARQEWQLAQALAGRNIPIVNHLALGERKSWMGVHESVLLTEGFDGLPLEESPNADLHAILRFVRRMHDAGVLQQDLHPGNLLVGRTSNEIRLVDLHGTVLKASLSPLERDQNLARLGASIRLPVSEDLLALSAACRRRLHHRRSHRCLRHNRDFAPWRAGRWNGWVRAASLTDAARKILQDPDAFLTTGARLLKAGRSATVGAADHLVLKRYNFRKPGNALKDLFRLSKARRAYQKGYHLELAGIPTAKIVATIDRRCYGVLLSSCVLMEEIPGAQELGAYLRKGGDIAPGLARQAAELIGTLHREGLTHRDLKESNVILDSSHRMHLLDLDGLEYVDILPDARAAFDLARFHRGVSQFKNVGRLHQLAFLRRYCRIRGVKHIPRG